MDKLPFNSWATKLLIIVRPKRLLDVKEKLLGNPLPLSQKISSILPFISVTVK